MHLTNTFDNSLYFRIEINDESFIMNYEGMLQLFMKFIIQLRFLFFLYCIEKTLYKLKIKKNKPIKRFYMYRIFNSLATNSEYINPSRWKKNICTMRLYNLNDFNIFFKIIKELLKIGEIEDKNESTNKIL